MEKKRNEFDRGSVACVIYYMTIAVFLFLSVCLCLSVSINHRNVFRYK